MQNLYLVVGIRGEYERRTSRIPANVDGALSHVLDLGWGITPPWGVCDSASDLETPGSGLLRGWNHVDLRRTNDDAPRDVPVAGLLRTTWDALEIYGATSLTGVDAMLPLDCVGEPMWSRVAGSVLRDSDRASDRLPVVLVPAGKPWPTSPVIGWKTKAILKTLAEFVEIRAAMDELDHAPYPPSVIPDPFGPADDDPFRAQVTLPAWTIDDAAWLVEALSIACRSSGVTQDIELAVRLVDA
jgi:hypothetical protein